MRSGRVGCATQPAPAFSGAAESRATEVGVRVLTDEEPVRGERENTRPLERQRVLGFPASVCSCSGITQFYTPEPASVKSVQDICGRPSPGRVAFLPTLPTVLSSETTDLNRRSYRP